MLNITDRDGVRLVEFAHSKVNALDLELLEALIDAFRDTEPDQPIVLTGAGRAFSAGVDLRRIVDEDESYTARFLDALSASFLAVFDHPAPVVAAVNGAAIAGGCVIAAACDRRLISRGPIGLAELAVGVAFPTSAVEIMRGVLGARMTDLMLTARLVEADEALAAGLVDEVVPAEELVDRAVACASRWGALPPGVFAHTKHQLQGPVRDRIAERTAGDDPAMRDLWASSGVRDAIAQYMAGLAQRR